MSEERKIEIIKPFGPAVAKVEIPENILKELNKYTDNLIQNQEKSISQELVIDPDFSKKSGWLNFLTLALTKWIEVSTKKKVTEIKSIKSCIVRRFANEYTPLHYNPGHISGTGFLKLPKEFGKTYQEKQKNYNGKFTFVHGNRQFLSSSVFPITPKVGDFYFFPHYLMCIDYPFDGSIEERRSISLNTEIDNRIFDVFS